MSAPRTNTETQSRRHRWPLIGMIIVVLFGVGIILYWMVFDVAGKGNTPQNGAQIDGRTGEITDQPETTPAPTETITPTPPVNAPQPDPTD